MILIWLVCATSIIEDELGANENWVRIGVLLICKSFSLQEGDGETGENFTYLKDK